MIRVASGDRTEIACRVAGAGPPLVLVRGTAADHTRWGSVSSALEGTFTVYAVDRRGRGESGDADRYPIEREFEVLRRSVMRFMGLSTRWVIPMARYVRLARFCSRRTSRS